MLGLVTLPVVLTQFPAVDPTRWSRHYDFHPVAGTDLPASLAGCSHSALLVTHPVCYSHQHGNVPARSAVNVVCN